jgi:hypothetical protein
VLGFNTGDICHWLTDTFEDATTEEEGQTQDHEEQSVLLQAKAALVQIRTS